jgi:dienelactone hydrolase
MKPLLQSVACLLVLVPFAWGGIKADGAALFLDFENAHPGLMLHHGPKSVRGSFGTALEFTTHLQFVSTNLSPSLHAAEAVSAGGWFFPRRSGEQYFLFRGVPETAPGGERMFRRNERWVNFVIGTDHRGFFLGTINGNGVMPFAHVTLSEVGINAWHQLIVVKDSRGRHKFYHNGVLVHTDEGASSTGQAWPFNEAEEGDPVRLSMPMGGLIGEAWVFARELSMEEIRADFESKKTHFHPAHPIERVFLREMNLHPAAWLWKAPPDGATWPSERDRIMQGVMKVLGSFPSEKPDLEPRIMSEEDCGSYMRRKVSIQVQPGDRMPAYLLVPKKLTGRAPAVICFYGTTSGAGKDTTVGISGRKPGTPPHRNNAFAIDMVEAGFVAFAPDYLRDGERVKSGGRPYDTTEFYEQFPDWSIVGKDVWDNMRAVDYLQTLDFVDPERIGMAGHSYGGHSTIFAAALESRIKAAVANGPVSDFLHHGMHWGVPKGAGNSQSLPGMRPYVLDHTLPLPVTFYEFTSLIAPRPLLVGQAVSERRPMEEENYAAVSAVYRALGHPEQVRFHWYGGEHDFPPEARKAAVEWFNQWLKAR